MQGKLGMGKGLEAWVHLHFMHRATREKSVYANGMQFESV